VDPVWSRRSSPRRGAIFGALALRPRRGLTGFDHRLGQPSSRSPWFRQSFAILSFLAGLRRIGPTDAATLSTLEPAMTALLAVLLLGEASRRCRSSVARLLSRRR